MAVLRAKIFNLPYPKNFRTIEGKFNIALEAAAINVPDFVPSDEKAKSIAK